MNRLGLLDGAAGATRPAGRPTFNRKVFKRPAKKPVVYFVQADSGLIKIGTTGFLAERIESLNNMSPVPLKLLCTTKGCRKVEHDYHRLFAEHRTHGEWFAPHADILAEIARLSGAEVQHG